MSPRAQLVIRQGSAPPEAGRRTLRALKGVDKFLNIFSKELPLFMSVLRYHDGPQHKSCIVSKRGTVHRLCAGVLQLKVLNNYICSHFYRRIHAQVHTAV